MIYQTPSVDPAILHTLRTVFGFESFRQNQAAIITSIMAGKDVFAVMSTGGGKSLCYQLPALLRTGTAVVLSPLISLMKDQVDAAQENGIAAEFMNSSLDQRELAEIHRKLTTGQVKLLYIAPERFAMPQFIETLKNIPLSLFAIDEAHCISEWGHDFRPDYLALSSIPLEFPGIPVAAFTATATQKVQQDIIKKIGLRKPHEVRASFNRPNLFYQVESKSNIEQQLPEFLAGHEGESGIIYRTTRDAVETTAAFLAGQGIKALPYHADLPKHIEAYYQETGRAGRDGAPAHCLLFFSRGDIPKIRYFIDRTPDEHERAIALEKLNQTVRFASHNVCRRKQLLSFFGEAWPADNCGACDICTGSVMQVDISLDAKILMSAMARTNERFGILHVIDVVMGTDTKRVKELGHDTVKTFGAGRGKDKNHWRFIVNELLAQELIKQDGDRYPVLKLTAKGAGVLTGPGQVFGLKREETKKSAGKRKAAAAGGFDQTLFERLRVVRKKIAEEQHVPPYVIFSDKTLHEMCRHFPTTAAALRQITGVGDVKLERHGERFIVEIKAYGEKKE